MNRSATVDLIGMGVWVTSFVIQEVSDDNEYITSLGKAEVAKKYAPSSVCRSFSLPLSDCL